MCIERPSPIMPGIRYNAFKVMEKVEDGYRPIYPNGLRDPRTFKEGEWYLANGVGDDDDAGFHAVLDYDHAVKLFEQRCGYGNGKAYSLLLVTLECGVVYEQSTNFLCEWFRSGIRGVQMKIIKELDKGVSL